MEENKTNINNKNESTVNPGAPQEPPKEIIPVKYSRFTERMMDRDKNRSERKYKMEKAAKADPKATKRKKFRKVAGWVAGGAAAIGAATYAVIRIVGHHSGENEPDDPVTEEDEVDGTNDIETVE